MRDCTIVGIVLICMAAGCAKQQPGKEEAPAPVSVRVEKPRRIQHPRYVPASGTIEATETADIGFQLPGRVARVFVDEGQAVRKGQILAELDATDYKYGLQASEQQAAAAQATLDKAQAGTRAEELEQARAAYDRAEDEYRRYRRLYERKSMAAADFAKVEAAYRAASAQYEMARNGARREDRSAAQAAVRQAEAQVRVHLKQLADTRLFSPINGVIARRSIDPGEMVSAGLPVFSIMDLQPARVRVGIPETDIGLIGAGQNARLTFPALPGTEFTGTVILVGIAADPNSRTFSTKIDVPNPGLQLKAGMIAEASIEARGSVDALVIPGEAILHDPQGSTRIYIYYPDSKRVHARRIEPGEVCERGIEIRSGLSGNELVVVAGQHKVREGLPVEVMP